MRCLVPVLLWCLAAPADAELVSTGVGMVGQRTVTSREVQIQHLLDVALTGPLAKPNLRTFELDSRAFAKAAQDTLLEHVVSLEAQSFNLMQILPEDLARAKRQAAAALSASGPWKSLHVDPREFDDGVRRKIQARRFVKFRTESSSLPVTDAEITRHFEDNRAKFGNATFDRVRDKVREALVKVVTEKRLREWYDGLLGKYAVKNLISEM